jgi:hypothetical protein
MTCENEYCIYQKENKCCFEKIELDSVGMCATCIRISLDENFLTTEKEKQLQEIDSRWE